MRALSISQLSELTGVDRRTVKSRVETLTPEVSGRSHLYVAREALPLIYELGAQEQKKLGTKLVEEQLRHETAKADKIDLQNKKMRGEMVAIEEVGQAVDKKFTAIRAGFLALPNKCAAEVMTKSSIIEVRAYLEDSVNEVLTELSEDSAARLTHETTEQANNEESEES